MKKEALGSYPISRMLTSPKAQAAIGAASSALAAGGLKGSTGAVLGAAAGGGAAGYISSRIDREITARGLKGRVEMGGEGLIDTETQVMKNIIDAAEAQQGKKAEPTDRDILKSALLEAASRSIQKQGFIDPASLGIGAGAAILGPAIIRRLMVSGSKAKARNILAAMEKAKVPSEKIPAAIRYPLITQIFRPGKLRRSVRRMENAADTAKYQKAYQKAIESI